MYFVILYNTTRTSHLKVPRECHGNIKYLRQPENLLEFRIQNKTANSVFDTGQFPACKTLLVFGNWAQQFIHKLSFYVLTFAIFAPSQP